MNDFLTRKIKVNGHVDVVLVYKLSLEQAGPATLDIIISRQVNSLDGVEALLEVSGGLFDGIRGRCGDGASAPKVGLALEEEDKHPYGHGT